MATPTTEASDRLLDRVRKLLAKAEAEGVTLAEAQALTAKAAELMAKYGIDRALLAAPRPETDRPASRLVDIYNPWARVQAHLLCGLAAAMRCQCILLPAGDGPARAHLRLRLRHRARRRAVHLGADADVARADRHRGPGPGLQRAGLAAQLAARLRGGGDGQGAGGRAARRAGGSRRAPDGGSPRRRWCSRTGPWSSGGTSRTPTRGPGRPGSPIPAAATGLAMRRASARTSAPAGSGAGAPGRCQQRPVAPQL